MVKKQESVVAVRARLLREEAARERARAEVRKANIEDAAVIAAAWGRATEPSATLEGRIAAARAEAKERLDKRIAKLREGDERGRLAARREAGAVVAKIQQRGASLAEVGKLIGLSAATLRSLVDADGGDKPKSAPSDAREVGAPAAAGAPTSGEDEAATGVA